MAETVALLQPTNIGINSTPTTLSARNLQQVRRASFISQTRQSNLINNRNRLNGGGTIVIPPAYYEGTNHQSHTSNALWSTVKFSVLMLMFICTAIVGFLVYKYIKLRKSLGDIEGKISESVNETRKDIVDEYKERKRKGELFPLVLDSALRLGTVNYQSDIGPLRANFNISADKRFSGDKPLARTTDDLIENSVIDGTVDLNLGDGGSNIEIARAHIAPPSDPNDLGGVLGSLVGDRTNIDILPTLPGGAGNSASNASYNMKNGFNNDPPRPWGIVDSASPNESFNNYDQSSFKSQFDEASRYKLAVAKYCVDVADRLATKLQMIADCLNEAISLINANKSSEFDQNVENMLEALTTRLRVLIGEFCHDFNEQVRTVTRKQNSSDEDDTAESDDLVVGNVCYGEEFQSCSDPISRIYIIRTKFFPQAEQAIWNLTQKCQTCC